MKKDVCSISEQTATMYKCCIAVNKKLAIYLRTSIKKCSQVFQDYYLRLKFEIYVSASMKSHPIELEQSPFDFILANQLLNEISNTADYRVIRDTMSQHSQQSEILIIANFTVLYVGWRCVV